jgi:hypothetical protein
MVHGGQGAGVLELHVISQVDGMLGHTVYIIPSVGRLISRVVINCHLTADPQAQSQVT